MEVYNQDELESGLRLCLPEIPMRLQVSGSQSDLIYFLISSGVWSPYDLGNMGYCFTSGPPSAPAKVVRKYLRHQMHDVARRFERCLSYGDNLPIA